MLDSSAVKSIKIAIDQKAEEEIVYNKYENDDTNLHSSSSYTLG